jgi:hypothetical protein
MKVKELIKRLSKFPQDAEVVQEMNKAGSRRLFFAHLRLRRRFSMSMRLRVDMRLRRYLKSMRLHDCS